MNLQCLENGQITAFVTNIFRVQIVLCVKKNSQQPIHFLKNGFHCL